MPYIKQKSENNKIAATLLKDNGLFCASIHCSYYSAFQLSKYVLSEYKGISYNTQDNSSTDSHNKIIELIRCNFGTTHDDTKNKKRFDELMGKLKRQRVLADYKINQLGKTIADVVFDMADEAKTILKDKYQIT